MIRAYRMLSGRVPYPLHLGVTEAGPPFTGSIKSAVGMGSLLADGIGDTIRVSLTADPVEEVKVCWEILKALGLRERGPVLIACPSCGRDNVGVQTLAEEVEERLGTYEQHFEVAVLGCAVNGPGESGDADFGIAGGRDVGFIYAHGKVLRKVESEILVDELFNEIDTLDRRRDAAAGAPQDGQAGRARDGRGVGHPARIASEVAMTIDRASKLFLPTLRDAPADAEAVSHKLLVRAGYIRQLGAGLWTFTPLGWRVHRKVEQIIREEMTAIGAQEWFAPVLTPEELWEATGRDSDPRDLPRAGSRGPRVRAAADPRGDVHLPRARAPELPAAAAGLVPLPDEGPRRAASPRRPAPRPRVHHEGLVLVRSRRGRASRRASARTRRAYHRIFERCGIEYSAVQAESGMMGGSASVDFLAPSGSGENTLVTCVNGDFAADLEVAQAVPRAPEFPPALAAPEEVETPGITTLRGARRRSSGSTSPRPRRRCR